MSEPSPYAMSPPLIDSGDVYIEVYPMKAEEHQGEQSARLIVDGEEPDFYDVMLRPDDWDQNQGVPYGEWEDLTLEDAEKKIEELEALNPGIVVNWVDP